MSALPFFRGLMNGLSAPAITFMPDKPRVRPDSRVYKSVYRSQEEDTKNLRLDFEKAIYHAGREVSRFNANK